MTLACIDYSAAIRRSRRSPAELHRDQWARLVQLAVAFPEKYGPEWAALWARLAAREAKRIN